MNLLTLWPWPLNPKTVSLVGYRKIIPYTEFEHFGIIRFWVMLWQTNRQTQLPMPAMLWVISTICILYFYYHTVFHVSWKLFGFWDWGPRLPGSPCLRPCNRDRQTYCIVPIQSEVWYSCKYQSHHHDTQKLSNHNISTSESFQPTEWLAMTTTNRYKLDRSIPIINNATVKINRDNILH